MKTRCSLVLLFAWLLCMQSAYAVTNYHTSWYTDETKMHYFAWTYPSNVQEPTNVQVFVNPGHSTSVAFADDGGILQLITPNNSDCYLVTILLPDRSYSTLAGETCYRLSFPLVNNG